MEIKNEAGKTCIDEAFKESKLESISNELLCRMGERLPVIIKRQ